MIVTFVWPGNVVLTTKDVVGAMQLIKELSPDVTIEKTKDGVHVWIADTSNPDM